MGINNQKENRMRYNYALAAVLALFSTENSTLGVNAVNVNTLLNSKKLVTYPNGAIVPLDPTDDDDLPANANCQGGITGGFGSHASVICSSDDNVLPATGGSSDVAVEDT